MLLSSPGLWADFLYAHWYPVFMQGLLARGPISPSAGQSELLIWTSPHLLVTSRNAATL